VNVLKPGQPEVFQELAPEPARADDQEFHVIVQQRLHVLARLEPRSGEPSGSQEEV